MWFIPTIEGSYEVLCAEYCGLRHSFMETKAIIISDTAFTRWLAQKSPETIENKGLGLLTNNACTSCHSLDGSQIVGPTFKGLYNSKRIVIINGEEKTVIADSAYIRRAIFEPDYELVKGFRSGQMRGYKTVLKEDDIKMIITYFETQKTTAK
jgi:cytochrome c oxidase subunit 2